MVRYYFLFFTVEKHSIEYIVPTYSMLCMRCVIIKLQCGMSYDTDKNH